MPQGVVCLLSALRFHDLTTQSPFEVWLAIGEKARLPKLDNPPLHIVRFSQKTLATEFKNTLSKESLVRIFSPAKTVADCFRYRNKIGLDVALEALRECRRKRRATSDDIWKAAKVCRVANVMRPYLESLPVSRERPRNLAASVRQRLFNRAQERHEDFGLVLTKYGLERFLYRLSRITIPGPVCPQGRTTLRTVDASPISSDSRFGSRRAGRK